MLEVRNLLNVLSILYILQILNFLLGKYQLVFTLLVGESKFFLEMLHLLDENLFVLEPLLKDRILFFFSLEVEFKQQVVLLEGWVGCWLTVQGLSNIV